MKKILMGLLLVSFAIIGFMGCKQSPAGSTPDYISFTIDSIPETSTRVQILRCEDDDEDYYRAGWIRWGKNNAPNTLSYTDPFVNVNSTYKYKLVFIDEYDNWNKLEERPIANNKEFVAKEGLGLISLKRPIPTYELAGNVLTVTGNLEVTPRISGYTPYFGFTLENTNVSSVVLTTETKVIDFNDLFSDLSAGEYKFAYVYPFYEIIINGIKYYYEWYGYDTTRSFIGNTTSVTIE